MQELFDWRSSDPALYGVVSINTFKVSNTRYLGLAVKEEHSSLFFFGHRISMIFALTIHKKRFGTCSAEATRSAFEKFTLLRITVFI